MAKKPRGVSSAELRAKGRPVGAPVATGDLRSFPTIKGLELPRS